jgi:hypothetical protein
MGSCKKEDMSERLMMALWPEQFPDEQPSIQGHLRDCPKCREELEMLRKFDTFIKEHKNELASAVSDCPASGALVEFALGEKLDQAIEGHLECCEECRKQVRLVQHLTQHDLSAVDEAALSLEERILIRKAVSAEYGEEEKAAPSSLRRYLDKLKANFNVPSLALGAVTAAVLLIFLLPQAPKEAPFHLVLSEVVWSLAGETINKGDGLFQRPLKPGKKVAVVIVVDAPDLLAQADTDDLYRALDMSNELGDGYELLSPAETKKALDDSRQKIDELSDLAEQVFGKTDADYVLAFRISRSGSMNALTGSLVRRGREDQVESLSHTGLSRERLPKRIKWIGTELLLEAGSP